MAESKKEKSPFEVLGAPTQAEEIEWRIANVSKDGSKTNIVPYVNNRSVMKRFDDAFGPQGWKNEFYQVEVGPGKKGWMCGISVSHNGSWITKWDGAEQTDIEPLKGGLSDAQKRVATQWGFGRDLYSYPKVFLKGAHKFIPQEINMRLDAMTKQIIEGKFKQDVVVL